MLMLSSCGRSEQDKQTLDKPSATPVLLVEQGDYRFSMYPEYVSENKSILKLDIRDKKELFVKGAKASANLKAEDGHQQTIAFEENTALQRYVADVPLKHHEDYVIETNIGLDAGEARLYTPRFMFHCGDPIPEVDGMDPIETQRGKKE